MEGSQVQPLSSSANLAVIRSEDSTPFSQQIVMPTNQEYIQLKHDLGYRKAQHARAVEHVKASETKTKSRRGEHP